MKLKQALPGFALGGSFVVPVTPGESQRVAFFATPGERVVVETPKERVERERDPK